MNTLTQRPSAVSAYAAEGKLDQENIQVRASYRTNGISITTGLSSLYLSPEAALEVASHLYLAVKQLEQVMAAREGQGGEV